MIPLFLTALILVLVAALRFLKENPFRLIRVGLTVASLACLAGLIVSCCFNSHWAGANPDLPMLSAGWLPIFLALALLSFTIKPKLGSRLLWTPRILIECGVLAAIGAFFILRGQVHHPVGYSNFPANVESIFLGLLLALVCIALISCEACPKELSPTLNERYGAAGLAFISVACALTVGYYKTASLSLASPPVMLACMLSAISLFHLLRPSEKPLPIASILVPIWCILWGLALEFA